MFFYKTYSRSGDTLLAIADSDVVGNSYDEGDLRLEVSESFYRGEECGDAEAVGLVESATIINAVGKNIISLLMKKGKIDESKILEISGVPHAQIVRI